MEARQEASRKGATVAWPGLVGRLLKGIDLRRFADAIQRPVPRLSFRINLGRLARAIRAALPRTLTARIYDSK